MFTYDIPEHRLVAVEKAVEHLMVRGIDFLSRTHGFPYDSTIRQAYLATYVDAGVRLLTREA